MTLTEQPEDIKDKQQKLTWAYSMLKPNVIKKAFPNGKAQAAIIIGSIANILGFNTKYLSAEDYYNILNIYAQIIMMFNIPTITDINIKKFIQNKYSQYITNEDINKVFAYAYINIPNTTFSATNSHHINIISALSEQFDKMDAISLQNSQTINSDYLAHPQYGLVPDRPIYLCGVRDLNLFLNNLETEKNNRLNLNALAAKLSLALRGILIFIKVIYIMGNNMA